MQCPLPSNETCEHLGEILVTSQQIDQAVARVAREVRNAYGPGDSVLALVLLEGARWFADDLFVQLGEGRWERQDFKASSYHGTTQSCGMVQTDELPCSVQGRSVLVIDDIYDTGRTLGHILDLLTQAGAVDVKTCVMFEKQCHHAHPIALDFLGLTVPDRFIVGYGLDFEGRYRDLKCVGVLPQHIDL